jgi:hypothetical protein
VPLEVESVLTIKKASRDTSFSVHSKALKSLPIKFGSDTGESRYTRFSYPRFRISAVLFQYHINILSTATVEAVISLRFMLQHLDS